MASAIAPHAPSSAEKRPRWPLLSLGLAMNAGDACPSGDQLADLGTEKDTACFPPASQSPTRRSGGSSHGRPGVTRKRETALSSGRLGLHVRRWAACARAGYGVRVRCVLERQGASACADAAAMRVSGPPHRRWVLTHIATSYSLAPEPPHERQRDGSTRMVQDIDPRQRPSGSYLLSVCAHTRCRRFGMKIVIIGGTGLIGSAMAGGR